MQNFALSLSQRELAIARVELDAYNRWRAHHHFDFVTMNYYHLTLVIESFMRRGDVGFFKSSVPNPLKLSQTASLDVEVFIKWTRAQVEIETVRASFKNMIYQLIKEALKPGPHQFASNRMLGFFMYHHFQLMVAGEVLPMDDHIENIWKEYEEILGRYHSDLPAQDFNWRKAQNYPGKDEMTFIMNQAYAPPRPVFMPMYQQLTEAEPMDISEENENPNIQARHEEVLDYLFGKNRPKF